MIDDIVYVDGRTDLRGRVLQRLVHDDIDRDLYIVQLEEGFWSVDRNKFVRFLIVHKDNLRPVPPDDCGNRSY